MFLSTTRDVQIATRFQAPGLMILIISPGVKILEVDPISKFQEQEIILGRNQVIEVIAIDGSTMIGRVR